MPVFHTSVASINIASWKTLSFLWSLCSKGNATKTSKCSSSTVKAHFSVQEMNRWGREYKGEAGYAPPQPQSIPVVTAELE